MTRQFLSTIAARQKSICERLELSIPILLAPMAGACPPALSAAVSNVGGMGACGALLFQPSAIRQWAVDYRELSSGSFQMNLWIPDPAPERSLPKETAMSEYLSRLGPPVTPADGDATPPDFDTQFEAILETNPCAISSIMGIFDTEKVAMMKRLNIVYMATVTSVEEALIAEESGADIIIAQGSEAGGHRGAFHAANGQRQAVGLFSLLPQVVDAVKCPVVATGGIADARSAYAAFVLGASAVQIGTGFLRTPEAAISKAWSNAIAASRPEETIVTRAFSGRYGRSISTQYTLDMESSETPDPLPYPIQRSLTGKMRAEANQVDDIDRMQAWAGQSASLAKNQPAGELLADIWNELELSYF